MSHVVVNKWYKTPASLAFVKMIYAGEQPLYKGFILSGIGQREVVWRDDGTPIGTQTDERLISQIDNIEDYLVREVNAINEVLDERNKNLSQIISDMQSDIRKANEKGSLWDAILRLETVVGIRLKNGDIAPKYKSNNLDSNVRVEKKVSWIQKYNKLLRKLGQS